MKMRLGAIIFVYVLMCLFFCICNGAAPYEVDAGSSSAKFSKFTKEEDKFIVGEVLRLLEVPRTYKIWNKITEKHGEKWRAGTPGFPQERLLTSIRSRFWDVLIKNKPSAGVKVPEELRDQLIKSHSKQKKGHSLPKSHVSEKGKYSTYSQQEDDLILEELRKPSCTSIFSSATIETIRKAHDIKRLTGINGFGTERKADSIRSRLFRLRKKGQLPNEELEKFSSYQEVPRHWYTPEEDNLIIQELTKLSKSSLFSTSAVDSIRAEHDRRRNAKIHGFENARSVGSISSRISTMKNTGLLPSGIAEKYSERNRALSHALGTNSGEPSSTRQSQQTDLQNAEIMDELSEAEIAEIMSEINENEANEMIEELYDDTEFDFNFSNFH